MKRTPTTPEGKVSRRSPLPVIGAVVAIILVAFYGWSQRGWLINVTDIESRDVDMQSRQLERGFETELADLHSALGDYAIWTETAELARGNRPNYFAESLNAGALVRLDVDTLLVLDRNLEVRASYAIDPTAQEYEIPPDPDLLAAIKQGVTSGQLGSVGDSVRGIVQRARGPACSPCGPSTTTPPPASPRAGSPLRAPSRPAWSSAWDVFRPGP